MKRKITSKLYEWKNMLSGRMPLLIYGARQVGKTFEMREFGALYYKNTIYVNFETDERIGKYFETDIHADHVISVLEKYYQSKIVPENTLIIFDEIQMCEALTLKYFSEEAPEYHVMAAGSLLGCSEPRKIFISSGESSDADHVPNGSGRGIVGKGKTDACRYNPGTL